MDLDKIICEICGDVVDKNKYDRHIKFGHREKPENRCHLCSKTFTSLYNLQYHLAHHINARNFLCNECPQAYNTAADLSQHKRTHEKQRDPYKCEECGLLFQIRSRFKTHLRTHRSNSKECQICKKEFASLADHNRIVHLGVRAHECGECGKKFGRKSGLDRHVQTVHQNIRAFKCDFAGCLRAFGEKSQLMRHSRTHMDKRSLPPIPPAIKAHKCPVEGCSRAFCKKTQLSKHLRTHSEPDRSYCNFCKQIFDNIKLHFDTIHSDLIDKCKICFKRFTKTSLLVLHERVVHMKEKNFFCDYCPDKGFAEKSQLKRHIRRHEESFGNKSNRLRKESESFWEDDFYESEESCNESLVLASDHVAVKMDPDPEQPPIAEILVDIKTEIISGDLEAVINEAELLIKSEPEDFEECEAKLISAIDDILLEEIEIKSEPEDSDSHNESVKQEQTKIQHSDETFDDEMILNPTNKNVCSSKGSSDDKTLHVKSKRRKVKEKSLETENEHEDKITGDEVSSSEEPSSPTNPSNSRVVLPKCEICGKTFTKNQALKNHVLAIHSEKSFECEMCSKKFSFKQAKDRHIKLVHLKERTHQCSQCERMFGTTGDLKYHIENHHGDPGDVGRHFCSPCKRSFSSSSALKRHHKSIHQNIKQQRPRDYRCRFCKEILNNKYQKEKHIAQVHEYGTKPMRTCGSCLLDFEFFVDFKKHIDSHENSFFCLICGIDNFNEIALNLHLENHKHITMDQRKFVCDSCGHKLFNKKQLEIHMRKHMKETNFYVCDICGKSYKFIAPFLYHKKVHEGTKDFVCTHCGKEFMRKQDLIVHTRSHTQEKPFKCTVCDKSFVSRPILQAHLQTHSSTRKLFKCQDCNMNFVDRSQARQHDEINHPDRCPFWCNACHKSFKHGHLLEKHMKFKHKSGNLHGIEDRSNLSQPNDIFDLWSRVWNH